MLSKYETGLFASWPSLWRLLDQWDGDKRTTWLIPTDVVNIGDHIHVDQHDPKSDGYGGSKLRFRLLEGHVYEAKGPWHSNARALLRRTGLDVRDLHATQVTLWEVEYEERTFKDYVKQEGAGNLHWQDVTRQVPVMGKVIYEEKEPVLGMYSRGERIAHAYANATGEPVFYHSESFGGSSSKLVKPGDEMHPMAVNYE